MGLYEDNRDTLDFLLYKLTPVNTLIILLNAGVFIFMLLTGDPSDGQFMYEHGADFWPDVVYGHEYYRLLTSAFLHFSLPHLFNNMVILGFVGDNLERAIGSVRYILFYLAAAVGSGAVSCAYDMYRNSTSISAGASGAIFGVVGGILVILIRNKGRLEDLSIRQVMLFAVCSIYYGITSVGVDNAAHIGGFVIGALLALILYRKPDPYSFRCMGQRLPEELRK